MSDAVLMAHARLLERYLSAVREVSGDLPMTEHDPIAASPCEVGEPDPDGHVLWRPLRRVPPSDLAALQREASISLSSDLHSWLSTWWCLPFEATFAGESMVLLGLAGPAEERAFGAQLRAHLAVRRKRGEADTVPVAALFDGRFLTVDNVSGRVLLESSERLLGVVSPSLATLLDKVVPLAL